MTITEMVSAQEEIIRLQSETIDGLFKILSQHLGAEYLINLPELGRMERAAQLHREIGEA